MNKYEYDEYDVNIGDNDSSLGCGSLFLCFLILIVALLQHPEIFQFLSRQSDKFKHVLRKT